MLVEDLLHLAGVHVHAAADDHVLEPVHDHHVPGLVPAGDVPGAEPAVLVERRLRVLRAAPVAGHDALAPDAQLTGGLEVLLGHLGAVHRDDPELEAVHRPAHGARAGRRVHGVEEARARVLGQPVALQHGHAEQLLRRAQRLHRQARTAGEGHAQPREVRRLGPGLTTGPGHGEERPVHGGHAGQERDAVVLQLVVGGLRHEPRHQGQGGPGEHRPVEHHREPEHVEHRQRREHDVVRAEPAQAGRRRHGVGTQVRVRQPGTLGPPRGARGVEQDGVVVGVPRGDLRDRGDALGGALPPDRFEVQGDHLDVDVPGHLVHGRQPGHGPEHARPGVLEEVLQLTGGEQRVERHHHRAQTHERLVDRHEGRDVGQHHGHPVPRAHPAVAQPAGRRGRDLVQFAVGHAGLADPQGHGIRLPGHGGREQLGHMTPALGGPAVGGRGGVGGLGGGHGGS